MSVTYKKSTFGLIANITRKILGDNRTRCEQINEVFLYGTEETESIKQLGLYNLYCIYYVIVHSSRTIDVCVPSLTSGTLTKCLLTMQQKNKVRVRAIIHNSRDFHNLQSLVDNGIEVKMIKSERLEHEFLLIDGGSEDAVALTGSLDYEADRVNCNRDATILTSEAAVVEALQREFDRIWHDGDQNNTSTDESSF